ncbi:putative nuclease HARBI1 [Cucumis melo var. makuwa]|uniref:Putative nuclease HARBI1 n=1 Tax=Cucumis melo var. makuwa TaxID=1194695 RepID=A0A5D3BSN2_CUCMM|nr:putative nuclease HARBI1 [Cucumis melo var. makuwa]
MDRRCFTILCHLLRTVAGLTSIEVVDVEEMVAMFLHIVAHDVKNRVIQREFMRSGETISRHFNMVLLVVIRLHDKLLKKPQPVNNDCTDQRWRWFENCLGALDGTYIKVNVPASDRARYRTHKGEVATNVLGLCDTKGDFVYVLAGWEGSAADSRILHDAISRPNGLKVPKGYYYLVDAGYPNVDGFLAAYRGQRYHLQEWRGVENAPSTSKEFFNMKHSSARNTKEEEAGLVECLVELVNGGGWRSDNGTFHPGYLNQLARVMAFKILEKEVFDDWVKSHPAAKGLLNKSFVHYDELSYVFGKDRATEGRAESFANNGSNDLAGYDAFIADAAPDMDFPPMYSQGLNMSFDDLMGTRTARVSERRNISSGSKQKRLGHATDSGDIVRTAIECRLMRILMRNVDDMKAFLKVLDNMKYPYCSIILQENR